MRHLLWALWVIAAVAVTACARDDSNTSSNTASKPVNKVTVAVGEGKELCFESKKDDAVVFRFEADQPLQFDLHYHAEDETYFPIPEHTTAAEKGQYLVPRDNTYCLQWTNGQNTDVELTADIEGAGAATWY